MRQVIAKTFGGLSLQYYFRQFVFGLVFPAFIYFMASKGTHPIQINVIVLMLINTLLYPYSRFVYESIMNFIIGKNFFLVNGLFMLIAKLFTMLLCWSMAIFIAPIGLAYLYYHHSKVKTSF